MPALVFKNTAEAAARVYDKACLALKGAKAVTNFPKEDYDTDEIESLRSLSTTQELVATLRRQSTCFTRGKLTRRERGEKKKIATKILPTCIVV